MAKTYFLRIAQRTCQNRPHLPSLSAYPEPMAVTGGFGDALSVVPPILGVIIVHPVVIQNRKQKNGEAT